jgi:arginine:agmatine antiporter
MGLFMATVIVVVNMIGTGIFLLPASMATIGSISLFGWIIATLGATGIGMIYALLGSAMPKPGGPYAYARDSLGPFLGFQTNYIYWGANLIGNIAVAATVTGYLAGLFPAIDRFEMEFTILIIWVATCINIAGPRSVGLSTGWATVIVMVPLSAIAIGGWYYFDATLFMEGWNPHHDTAWEAISNSVPFALWAYMGIESAAVDASVIDNPKRTVPLATILGLAIAAVLYISTCMVLMGILPMEELAKSTSPFSDAALKVIGPIGATIIGICAIMKAGSSLVGWTLNISETAAAAARDGLFPKIYGRTDGRGIPVWNFLISGILMSLVVIATASPSLNEQFNKIIDMAVILVVLPYLYSSVSYLEYEFSHGRSKWCQMRAILVVATASIYCLWVIVGSDADLTRDALIILFISVPLYPFFERRILKGQRNPSNPG